MKNLIQFIQDSIVVSDFQKEYIERNLSKILNLIIIVSAIVMFIGLIGFDTYATTIITLSSIILFAILKFLNKRQHQALSGIFTSFVLIIIANSSLYIGRGFHDEAMLIFPGIIVLASLIVNRNYFIFFTAISILNVMLVGLLEINGIFINNLSLYTRYPEVFIASSILAATAFGVFILNSNLMDASHRASESGFQFKSFFNSSPEGIIIMDLDGKINNVNRSLLKIFNINKNLIINQSFEEFVKESEIPKIRKIVNELKKGIARDEPIELDIQIGKDSYLPISIKGFLVRDSKSRPIALGAFIEDISEKYKLLKEKSSLEDQLTHVQKMEAIGTLAGGIAHDFNNILVGILGFTELAIAKEKDEKIASYLNKVQHAGNRAKGLVEQILKFSRREIGEFRPVSINSILTEVIKLLESSLPSTITITKQFDLDKDIINGDETQIHQILMNLCTNAFHAMKKRGGTLSIHINNFKLTEVKKFLNMQILPGNFIRISVADNGTGMSPETIQRIFEPYFTTKKVEEGTGLGLSVTMGIVQNHQGLIEVESTPNIGTTFSIYLPEFKDKIVSKIQPISATFMGNEERILVLDDEFYFTDVMHGFLKGMNLIPKSFNDSYDALAEIKSNPELFHCIITDLTMPNMDGLEFISEVREINSDIPIILCSGFSEQVTEETAKYYGITKFLNKPVSKSDISNALKNILEE